MGAAGAHTPAPAIIRMPLVRLGPHVATPYSEPHAGWLAFAEPPERSRRVFSTATSMHRNSDLRLMKHAACQPWTFCNALNLKGNWV